MSNYDPTDIQSQDRSKARKAERSKLEQDNEVADLKWLMGTKQGRRIIWRQLDRAGVYRLSFNTNAMTMAFAEGNRNEGLRTVAMINANCPDLYTMMVKENSNATRHTDDGNRNDH